ncbi:LytR/AlgR family response regulator transcription factor [Taibaiella soli]|uniref:DNA-binding response regulator n=1 Tax=Taibaiella soli TaxID=1649169 RepID=A0A2W2ALG8_9BACT|nr:LytTR family DNA-binding domain-containing protein [Taibaiella soli]PZF74422.1 DNA-binding response regulator [Taibaiella soli]
MIRCVILDDEEHALDVLTQHIQRHGQFSLIAATTSITEVLKLASDGAMDLLFLDIDMPGISGLELAKLVVDQCEIIFTTGCPDCALNSYEIGAIDYLLKPISYTRFLKAALKARGFIKRTKSEASSVTGFFYVKTGIKNSVVKIAIDKITHVEGLQNYVGIYHEGKKTMAYLTLKELEAALPNDRFVRVHRSFIVSIAAIVKIENNCIELNDVKDVINVGESYKTKLWEMVRKHTLGGS